MVKFILLPVVGALIYHAVQVRSFMGSLLGMLLPHEAGFARIFANTLFQTAPSPVFEAISGPSNALIGGGIGLGVAIVVHSLVPRLRAPQASGAAPGLGEGHGAAGPGIANPSGADTKPPKRRPLFALLVVAVFASFAGGLGWMIWKMDAQAGGLLQPGVSSDVRFQDLRGEWFGPARRRVLRVFGSVRNEGVQPIANLSCTGTLRVKFVDGSPELTSEAPCGTGWELPPGRSKSLDQLELEVPGGVLDATVNRAFVAVVVSGQPLGAMPPGSSTEWFEIPVPVTKTGFVIWQR